MFKLMANVFKAAIVLLFIFAGKAYCMTSDTAPDASKFEFKNQRIIGIDYVWDGGSILFIFGAEERSFYALYKLSSFRKVKAEILLSKTNRFKSDYIVINDSDFDKYFNDIAKVNADTDILKEMFMIIEYHLSSSEYVLLIGRTIAAITNTNQFYEELRSENDKTEKEKILSKWKAFVFQSR